MITSDLITEASSFPTISDSKDSLILSTSTNTDSTCANCQATILQEKFAQLETKIDTIFSLASTLNSKHLHHNSQALFNLSASSTDCLDSMKNSRCINLVVRLIYEEWNELYDFYDLFKQKRLEQSSFTLLSDRICLLEILNRRLLSRELANQTLANLIGVTNTSKELRIYESIKKLNVYSHKFYSYLISRIDTQTLDCVYIEDHVMTSSLELFSCDTLNSLNENLNDLAKRSLDEEQRFYLCKLGGSQAICEFFTIICTFIKFIESSSIENQISKILNKLTLSSILVLNNLTASQSIGDQLCTRKYWLTSVFSFLTNLINKAVTNSDNSTDIHDLIKTLVCLLRNLAASVNTKSSSSLILNQHNFPKLLTKLCLFYNIHNQRPCNLKVSIQALLNFSTLSSANKEAICNVPDALSLFISLVGPVPKDGNSKSQIFQVIEELASSLLRSLSVVFTRSPKLKKILKTNNLYTILLNYSLYSPNLKIVANSCGILWSLSARSSQEQKILLDLGAHTRLTLLAHSTNKLISMISIATLKNLLKMKNNGNSSDTITDSTSGLDLSVSSSSSISLFTNIPILAGRSRMQRLETEKEKDGKNPLYQEQNDMNGICSREINKITSDDDGVDEDEESGDYSSPEMLSSVSTTSCDSFGFSSDLSSSTSDGSFDLESSKTSSSKRVKSSQINNSNKKHVTFSGNKEMFVFEVDNSDSSGGSYCDLEIIDIDEIKKEGVGKEEEVSNDMDEDCDDIRSDLRFIKSKAVDSVKLVNSPDEMHSLSSLLEPAKNLINKMDAKMNGTKIGLEAKTIATKSCLKQTSNSLKKKWDSKKPLAECVNMTKTSQLRRSLNKQINYGRSESVKVEATNQKTQRPNIPKRTTSLQPPVKTMERPKDFEIKKNVLRTNTFIILDKIKNMKIDGSSGIGTEDDEIYQV